MSATSAKQVERPVPLRLTEAVPYEEFILQQYKAIPRGRRMEWLRSLLKRGLDSMVATGEVPAYRGWTPITPPAAALPTAALHIVAPAPAPAPVAAAPAVQAAAPAVPASAPPPAAAVVQTIEKANGDLPDARAALAGFSAMATGGKTKKAGA